MVTAARDALHVIAFHSLSDLIQFLYCFLIFWNTAHPMDFSAFLHSIPNNFMDGNPFHLRRAKPSAARNV